MEILYEATSLWTTERMKHQLVFQHEPPMSFCLDSRSKASVCPISTDKQDLWCCTHSLSRNNRLRARWSFWTLLKEHKCQGNYSGGKRKQCTAVVQDMASWVFRRAHLKGCHCQPACLLVGFSVWVLSTIVSYGGYAENLFSQGWQCIGSRNGRH